jgi:hypothetical protein
MRNTRRISGYLFRVKYNRLCEYLPAILTKAYAFTVAACAYTGLTSYCYCACKLWCEQEQLWLESYASIGQDIAALGSPDWSAPSNRAKLGTLDGQHGPEVYIYTNT